MTHTERVIEVWTGEKWIRRVAIKIVTFPKWNKSIAVCWNEAEKIEDAVDQISTVDWHEWREIEDSEKVV